MMAWLVAGIFIECDHVSLAAENNSRPVSLEFPAQTSVFGTNRPKDTDLLLLTDGKTLAGIVSNETLNLRAAYALLKLENQAVASLALESGQGGLDTLITINGDRFSGLLETPGFVVQPATGARIEIRRERVVKILFHQRPPGIRGAAPGHWIQLRNGDGFNGQLLADPLRISTDQTTRSVAVKDMAWLTYQPEAPERTTVALSDGQVVQGRLDLEDLPIRLDIGPQITVYKGWLTRMSEPGRREAETTGTAPYSISPTKAGVGIADLAATNIDGFVWIPPGQFTMGSPPEEIGRDQDEGPQTRVVLPQGFWIGKHEVTQSEYRAVMGANPSNAPGDPNQPVERVNWFEAVEYCARLTQREQANGRLPPGCRYRLPTEAEWEYACRAGTATAFCYGDDRTYAKLDNSAWFARNSDSMTHPVGTRQPNPWGLFDMHGNVWEWCLDRWEGPLPGGSITNTSMATEGSLRVARGGSWLYEGRACRSANRDDYGPSNRCSDIGFRVVLAPSP